MYINQKGYQALWLAFKMFHLSPVAMVISMFVE
jgi:hypothetical protein